jgi:predicted nucleic acid-binding protein
LRIFLDTSLLSEAGILSGPIKDQIVQGFVKGDQFYLSVITHFQVMWGYSMAGRTPEKYEEFLKTLRIEVLPLTKLDAEEAAAKKPSKKDILDALIASSVKKYDAAIWTLDRDFLKFLHKSRVRIL